MDIHLYQLPRIIIVKFKLALPGKSWVELTSSIKEEGTKFTIIIFFYISILLRKENVVMDNHGKAKENEK